MRSWYTTPPCLSANALNAKNVGTGWVGVVIDNQVQLQLIDGRQKNQHFLLIGQSGREIGWGGEDRCGVNFVHVWKVAWRCWTAVRGSHASDPMSWPFHMAFCCGWAWVQVFEDQLRGEVRAPLEETPLHRFE